MSSIDTGFETGELARAIKHSDMEVRQRQSFGLEVPTGEESGS
jgi:hypothetical protein